jgi:hypothetical protein
VEDLAEDCRGWGEVELFVEELRDCINFCDYFVERGC